MFLRKVGTYKGHTASSQKTVFFKKSFDFECIGCTGCSLLQQRTVRYITANVPGSLILSTLKMEATRSYETAVLTSPTPRHIWKTAYFMSEGGEKDV
jgi:hypothetical protein